MRNFADDVVTLVSGLPLVEGRDSARALYTQMLAAGAWDATHHYAGAAVTVDSVVVHGVARGTFTPPGGQPSPVANNFILAFRRNADRHWRAWRVAFAPAGA
jgi:ketosteroid isomerase-like protein